MSYWSHTIVLRTLLTTNHRCLVSAVPAAKPMVKRSGSSLGKTAMCAEPHALSVLLLGQPQSTDPRLTTLTVKPSRDIHFERNHLSISSFTTWDLGRFAKSINHLPASTSFDKKKNPVHTPYDSRASLVINFFFHIFVIDAACKTHTYTHGSVKNLSGWIWEEAELENKGWFLFATLTGWNLYIPSPKGTLVEQARILVGESLEAVSSRMG